MISKAVSTSSHFAFYWEARPPARELDVGVLMEYLPVSDSAIIRDALFGPSKH